jgi:hypothetical protein
MNDYWDDLPDRKWVGDALAPRCPWCRDEICDLSIPIGALQDAWEHGVLTGKGNWLWRGRRFEGAACSCPRCQRPLLVKLVQDHWALRSHERFLIIATARTPADARYLAAQGQP